MHNKYRLIGSLLLFGIVVTSVSKAEISTLFTTAQERQLINTNRYQSDQVKPPLAQKASPAKQNIQQLVREQVRETLTISGITLSNSGPHMVWINNQVYEDGDRMENQSRIKVLTANQIKVRITAPGGRQYFAASGETIEIVYLATVE